ncbi:MAG TPA: response regulator [Terriglobales bacterium]|nr:response regulator [Terriglobales bacterium]
MKRSILIVEDLAALTLTYRLIFEADGWTAVCAENKETAIEAMQNLSFDVVFTDLNLEEDQDGLEVVRAAKQQEQAPATIVVSGYLDPEIEQASYSVGADLVLAKPLQIPLLKAEIQRLLARRKRAAAA